MVLKPLEGSGNWFERHYNVCESAALTKIKYLTVLDCVRRQLSGASLAAMLLILGPRTYAEDDLCGPVVEPLPLPVAGTDAESSEIEISSDSADMSRDGNAHLTGNVQVRQGEKKITAEDVEYDATTGGFRSKAR